MGGGGRGEHELKDLQKVDKRAGGENANWDTIGKVVEVMRFTYRRLALVTFIASLVLGPLLLSKPISQIDNQRNAWLALAVLVACSFRMMYRRVYNAYLKGLNHMALVNRWEALTGALGLLTGVVVVLMGGRILALTCSLQFWGWLGMARNRWLAMRVDEGRFAKFTTPAVRPELFNVVWSSAWKTGIGMPIINNYSKIFGLAIAQFFPANVVVVFLFASRMVEAIKNFASAGFNPKVPKLASLRAAGEVEKQTQVAKRTMMITHWVYLLPIVALGFMGPWLLEKLGSKMPFPEFLLWILLAMKDQLLQLTLMHLQIYQITNKIVVHKVIFWIIGVQTLACVGLFNWLGIYALPVGCIIGLIFPMIWLCRLSYRSMDVSFWEFESKVSLAPVCLLLLITTYGLLGRF